MAGDADEAYGMARVDSQGGNAYLWAAAGTSNSAPLWGGLVALADQYAHHDLGPLIPPLCYRPQLQLPHGISRHYDRYQRLPGRSRMGPGNGLGNP